MCTRRVHVWVRLRRSRPPHRIMAVCRTKAGGPAGTAESAGGGRFGRDRGKLELVEGHSSSLGAQDRPEEGGLSSHGFPNVISLAGAVWAPLRMVDQPEASLLTLEAVQTSARPREPHGALQLTGEAHGSEFQ